MSFKNVMMSSVAALALLSSSANAAVTLENDGTGDYLLFPATYSNTTGWNTELKVVNTNTTHAIVARVVIRNGHDSQELFDFPIYLTPGDAWEGTLKINDISGQRVTVETTDDSAMMWAGSAGHIIRGNVEGFVGQDALTTIKADSELDVLNRPNGVTDGRRSTYVEVFGLAAYDADTMARNIAGYSWAVGTPFDKVKFFQYVRNVAEGTPKTQLNTPGPLNDLYDSGAAVTDVDNDSLLGKQVIVNDTAKLNMAMNAVALGEVSAAERMSQVIGTATTMNAMSDKGVNVVEEMQAVLTKNEIYVMNEGEGNTPNPMRIHFTDPLKKYHQENLTLLPDHYIKTPGSNDIKDYYYTFVQVAHDMEENLSKCGEKGGNTDFSNDGFDTKDCNSTKVYYEVQKIQNGTSASDTLPIEFIYNGGGFLTYTLEQNTSVVPTTFSSSTLSGSAVNYHIANQYKAGATTVAP